MRAALLVLLIPMAAAASDKGLWLDFRPYPGARLLCSETVRGSKGEHIVWRSLATADPPAAVVAFYEKSEKAKAEKRDDGAYHLAARADPERVKMSIYPVDLIDRFPRCAEPARKGERTVILVSQKI